MTDWEEIARRMDEPDDGSYLSTDEFDEVVAALRHLRRWLCEVEYDTSVWKWILLAAHSAAQNACVAYLTNTAGIGALDKRSTKQLLEYLDDREHPDRIPPKERLAEFPELLRRLPGTLRVDFNALTAPLGYDHAADLWRLHEFRNEFSHFKPKSWLIEIAGLPRILKHSLELVNELVNSDAYQRWNRFRDNGANEALNGCFLALERFELQG